MAARGDTNEDALGIAAARPIIVAAVVGAVGVGAAAGVGGEVGVGVGAAVGVEVGVGVGVGVGAGVRAMKVAVVKLDPKVGPGLRPCASFAAIILTTPRLLEPSTSEETIGISASSAPFARKPTIDSLSTWTISRATMRLPILDRLWHIGRRRT